MQYLGKNRLSADQYISGILANDTVILSKALSLMESGLKEDKDLAIKVLDKIYPQTGKSIRIGITGSPGVGKSTFIESFGLFLVDQGYRLAVLTIDPSSQKTKGSILGDKTRMDRLSNSKNAYIRPSAAGKSLGGVADHIRESVLLCEAAGYDLVIIETVGVGQSETLVKDMVDFFLLLMIAGAGDELQGIKKGIIEMADALVINKADGENLKQAHLAKAIYQNALHLLSPANHLWQPPVLTCSSINAEGIDKIWSSIKQYIEIMKENGQMELRRREQRISWMQGCIRAGIDSYFKQKGHDTIEFANLKKAVAEGTLSPNVAAESILKELINKQE